MNREAYGVRTGRPDLDAGEFAQIIGVEAETYRRYERGETQPKLSTLITIKRVTGQSLDWLITGTDEKAARPALKVVERSRV